MNPKIEGRETEDRFSREVLEFPAVLELFRGYLSGPISEPFLDSVEPHTRIDLIRRELEQAREAREYLRESPRPTLGSLRDPRPLLEKASQSWSRTLPQIFACFSCLFQFVTDQINSRMRLNRIKERLADWPGEVAAE